MPHVQLEYWNLGTTPYNIFFIKEYPEILGIVECIEIKKNILYF
jgi:hypothetical protein